MRFGYYHRLSKRDRAIYRQSDAYDRVELEAASRLVPLAEALGPALARDDRVEVERVASRLVRGICRQMGIEAPSTRVLDARPRDDQEELHGMYIRDGEELPVLLVWMRTASRRRPVAHRAFFRTLMHEVCHHLDYELLDLADSFHTEGFFQREGSLVRQLLPSPPRAPQPAPAGQLELFANASRRRAR